MNFFIIPSLILDFLCINVFPISANIFLNRWQPCKWKLHIYSFLDSVCRSLQHKTFVKDKTLEIMTKIVIHNKHQNFDKLHVINYYNSYHFLPTHIQTGHKFHIFMGRIDVRQACLSACTHCKCFDCRNRRHLSAIQIQRQFMVVSTFFCL